MSDEAATKPAPKARKGKLLIFLVVGLLLAGGGGGAYWWLTRASAEEVLDEESEEGEEADAGEGEDGAADGQNKKKAAKPPEAHDVLALEPFLVNLADKEASRFVRVTMRLAITEKGGAAHVEENAVLPARLRSAILELLAVQTADRLTSPEGKAELKTAIAERASEILGDIKVVDVLFTDFLVQF